MVYPLKVNGKLSISSIRVLQGKSEHDKRIPKIAIIRVPGERISLLPPRRLYLMKRSHVIIIDFPYSQGFQL